MATDKLKEVARLRAEHQAAANPVSLKQQLKEAHDKLKTYEALPPPKKKNYTFSRTLTLDDETCAVLRQYGWGNLSLGVRRAAMLVTELEKKS